ncbi:hypothetical protein BJ742DRAFT_795376 [Cladochytrium replicatum]|nr:hypothetical protein BJ742DRAFT_795376 [Cladochytrium replicatum]
MFRSGDAAREDPNREQQQSGTRAFFQRNRSRSRSRPSRDENTSDVNYRDSRIAPRQPVEDESPWAISSSTSTIRNLPSISQTLSPAMMNADLAAEYQLLRKSTVGGYGSPLLSNNASLPDPMMSPSLSAAEIGNGGAIVGKRTSGLQRSRSSGALTSMASPSVISAPLPPMPARFSALQYNSTLYGKPNKVESPIQEVSAPVLLSASSDVKIIPISQLLRERQMQQAMHEMQIDEQRQQQFTAQQQQREQAQQQQQEMIQQQEKDRMELQRKEMQMLEQELMTPQMSVQQLPQQPRQHNQPGIFGPGGLNPLASPSFNPLASPGFNPLASPGFNPLASPGFNPLASPVPASMEPYYPNIKPGSSLRRSKSVGHRDSPAEREGREFYASPPLSPQQQFVVPMGISPMGMSPLVSPTEQRFPPQQSMPPQNFLPRFQPAFSPQLAKQQLSPRFAQQDLSSLQMQNTPMQPPISPLLGQQLPPKFVQQPIPMSNGSVRSSDGSNSGFSAIGFRTFASPQLDGPKRSSDGSYGSRIPQDQFDSLVRELPDAKNRQPGDFGTFGFRDGLELGPKLGDSVSIIPSPLGPALGESVSMIQQRIGSPLNPSAYINRTTSPLQQDGQVFNTPQQQPAALPAYAFGPLPPPPTAGPITPKLSPFGPPPAPNSSPPDQAVNRNFSRSPSVPPGSNSYQDKYSPSLVSSGASNSPALAKLQLAVSPHAEALSLPKLNESSFAPPKTSPFAPMPFNQSEFEGKNAAFYAGIVDDPGLFGVGASQQYHAQTNVNMPIVEAPASARSSPPKEAYYSSPPIKHMPPPVRGFPSASALPPKFSPHVGDRGANYSSPNWQSDDLEDDIPGSSIQNRTNGDVPRFPVPSMDVPRQLPPSFRAPPPPAPPVAVDFPPASTHRRNSLPASNMFDPETLPPQRTETISLMLKENSAPSPSPFDSRSTASSSIKSGARPNILQRAKTILMKAFPSQKEAQEERGGRKAARASVASPSLARRRTKSEDARRATRHIEVGGIVDVRAGGGIQDQIALLGRTLGGTEELRQPALIPPMPAREEPASQEKETEPAMERHDSKIIENTSTYIPQPAPQGSELVRQALQNIEAMLPAVPAGLESEVTFDEEDVELNDPELSRRITDSVVLPGGRDGESRQWAWSLQSTSMINPDEEESFGVTELSSEPTRPVDRAPPVLPEQSLFLEDKDEAKRRSLRMSIMGELEAVGALAAKINRLSANHEQRLSAQSLTMDANTISELERYGMELGKRGASPDTVDYALVDEDLRRETTVSTRGGFEDDEVEALQDSEVVIEEDTTPTPTPRDTLVTKELLPPAAAPEKSAVTPGMSLLSEMLSRAATEPVALASSTSLDTLNFEEDEEEDAQSTTGTITRQNAFGVSVSSAGASYTPSMVLDAYGAAREGEVKRRSFETEDFEIGEED